MVARSAAGCSAISRPICDMRLSLSGAPRSPAVALRRRCPVSQAGPKTCRPPIQVALARRSGPSQTRSAGRTRGNPAQVGTSDQVGGDPGGGGHGVGQADARRDTMLATAVSIRSADPARVPSARTGGGPAPGGSSIGSPPSRYRPGGMPGAGGRVGDQQIRPGAAANAIRQAGRAHVVQVRDQAAGQPGVGQRLADDAGLPVVQRRAGR